MYTSMKELYVLGGACTLLHTIYWLGLTNIEGVFCLVELI